MTPSTRLAEIEADPKFADAEDWLSASTKAYATKHLTIGLLMRQRAALEWWVDCYKEVAAIARGLEERVKVLEDRNANQAELVDDLRKRAEQAEAALKAVRKDRDSWKDASDLHELNAQAATELSHALTKERDAARENWSDCAAEMRQARAEADALRAKGWNLRVVLMGIAHDYGDTEAGKWAWKAVGEIWPEGITDKDKAALAGSVKAAGTGKEVEEAQGPSGSEALTGDGEKPPRSSSASPETPAAARPAERKLCECSVTPQFNHYEDWHDGVNWNNEKHPKKPAPSPPKACPRCGATTPDPVANAGGSTCDHAPEAEECPGYCLTHNGPGRADCEPESPRVHCPACPRRRE